MEEKAKVITGHDVGVGLNVSAGVLTVSVDDVTVKIENGKIVAKQGVDLRVKQVNGDQASGKLKVTIAGENGEDEQVIETSLSQLMALSKANGNVATTKEDGIYVGEAEVFKAVSNHIDSSTVLKNVRGELSSKLQFTSHVRVVEAGAISHFVFRKALNSSQQAICTGFKVGDDWYGDRPDVGNYKDLFSDATLNRNMLDDVMPALVAPSQPTNPSNQADPTKPVTPAQPTTPVTDRVGFFYTPSAEGGTLELVNWDSTDPDMVITEFDGVRYTPALTPAPVEREELSNGKYKFTYKLKPTNTSRDDSISGVCDFTINGKQIYGDMVQFTDRNGNSNSHIFGAEADSVNGVIEWLSNHLPSS